MGRQYYPNKFEIRILFFVKANIVVTKNDILDRFSTQNRKVAPQMHRAIETLLEAGLVVFNEGNETYYLSKRGIWWCGRNKKRRTVK